MYPDRQNKIPSDKIFCHGSGYWGRDLIQSKYKGPDGGQIKITKPEVPVGRK